MAMKKRHDISRGGIPKPSDTGSETTPEQDPGTNDQYATGNTDEEDVNVRMTGDRTAWDSGRGSSIAEGTHAESDTRAADAETPGVPTKPADDQ